MSGGRRPRILRPAAPNSTAVNAVGNSLAVGDSLAGEVFLGVALELICLLGRERLTQAQKV